MGNRDSAARTLKGYFRQAAQAAGTQWTNENDADIDGAVDALIAASVQAVAEDRARAAQARREAEAIDVQAQQQWLDARAAQQARLRDRDSYSAPMPDEYRQTATQED